MRNVGELIGSQDDLYRKLGENIKSTTRVAEPGIIQSFDPAEQTVSVQLSLREQTINQDGTKQWVNLPLLLDVPIVIPKAGGYMLTFPIKKGDECLVIFGDMCIDSWWSLGGVQNPIEKRRHDLSDGFAILGIFSQPNVIPNYSTTSMQLRSQDGKTYIDLMKNQIDIVADTVTNNGIILATTTELDITKQDILNLTANMATITQLNATNANIVNLTATTAHITNGIIDNATIDIAKINNLSATYAAITNLNATNADIVTLTANTATVSQLVAVNANILSLSATYATITNLNATNAYITDLQANKADITDLTASNAKITNLTSNVATIQNIINGNITSANMATGAIQAGSAVIAQSSISSAQIIDLDVIKINAGTISTDKFVVSSDSGNLKIQGNVMKVWDTSGKERVSLGLNGTDYNLLVRGTDGTTVMFGTTGVTNAGITTGAVDDSKVAVNANIDGGKIEKESLITTINGATTTLKASRVMLDTEAQILDIAFTSLKSTVTSTTNTVSSQGTSISTIQGQITSKIWNTDVTTAVGAVQSQITIINNNYSTLNQTVSGITSSVASLNSKTDTTNGNVTSVNNQVSTLSQTVNGISSSVTSIQQNYLTTASASSTYATSTTVSSLSQSLSGLSSTVTNVQTTVNGMPSQISGITFTGMLGCSTSNNVITKIVGAGWGNSGCSSSQTFANGQYIEETLTANSLRTMFGLSHTDVDKDYIHINYAWYSADATNLQIYENGTQKYNCSWVIGDILRLAIENNVVNYYQNGILRYTSSQVPSLQLVLDASLHDNGTSISNVKVGTMLSGLSSRISTTESSITQLNNNIALKVSTTDLTGNTIASLINQSATTVSISANKLNLTGYITATSLSTAGATTINGANITTGTLTADKISGGTLTLGGATNGVETVKNASGLEVVRLDKDGLTITFQNVPGQDYFGNAFNIQAYDGTTLMNINGNGELLYHGVMDVASLADTTRYLEFDPNGKITFAAGASGTNSIGLGIGDGEAWTTYDMEVSCWDTMAFGSEAPYGGTGIAFKPTILMGCRTGNIYVKGQYRIYASDTSYYTVPKSNSGASGIDIIYVNEGSSPTLFAQTHDAKQFAATMWQSDISLKKNINISTVNATDRLNQVNCSSFTWRCDDKYQSLGVISQDLYRVNPDWVIQLPQTDGTIQMQPNVGTIIPYLIKSNQELSEEGRRQNSKILALEGRINALESRASIV